MISLLKFVDGPWEKAKRYLYLDLETIQSSINQRWSATFGDKNILVPAAGGLGITTPFVIGDIITALSTTAWARIADVAIGSILVSGGVGALPLWSANPTIIGIVTEEKDNIAQTLTDGVIIQNTTLSTAGVPIQISPSLRFRSHVWNTTVVAADNTDDWLIVSQPNTGATPIGAVYFRHSSNGAAYTQALALNQLGNLKAGGNVTCASTGVFEVDNRSIISSPLDGQFNLGPNAGFNVGLDVLTSNLLKIRTTAQTGNAKISVGADAIATTSTDGHIVVNDTLSTAGVPVQQSPRIRLRSHTWNTTAVAADNTDDWLMESVPVSGTTPSGLLKFGSSLNGAAATYPLTVTSAGILSTLSHVMATGRLSAGAGQTIEWLGRVRMQSPADGALEITDNAIANGIAFDVTTDSVVKVRNRARNADGSITFLTYTHSGAEVDKTYTIVVPVTGDTKTMAAGQSRIIFNPAGTLALLTVTLPSSPVDGQVAGLSFTQIITGLTINAPGGATVVAPPTSAAVDSNFRFLYQASSTSWFPCS